MDKTDPLSKQKAGSSEACAALYLSRLQSFPGMQQLEKEY